VLSNIAWSPKVKSQYYQKKNQFSSCPSDKMESQRSSVLHLVTSNYKLVHCPSQINAHRFNPTLLFLALYFKKTFKI
jgi:hypothetical protein